MRNDINNHPLASNDGRTDECESWEILPISDLADLIPFEERKLQEWLFYAGIGLAQFDESRFGITQFQLVELKELLTQRIDELIFSLGSGHEE